MQPLLIGAYEIGVQKNLKPFMIPEGAFPDLLNAFVFRGRVQRKSGYKLLGRLRRSFNTSSLGNFSSATTIYNLYSLLGITETNSQIQSGFTIVIGAPDSQTLTDSGTGTLAISPVDATKITSAVINYNTGILTLTWGGVVGASAATFTGGYFPTLPVMGIRTRELPTQVNQEQTIFFDTKYAYIFSAQFSELPSTLPTTWSGADSQLFWSTNYQVDASNNSMFWASNNNVGLHQYPVTLFAGAAAGPPSTVNVTSAGNTFQLGDTVYFVNLSGAGAANNLTIGTVTVAGNPFTISNPDANVFANGIVTGMAVSPNRNVSGDGVRIYAGSSWSNFNPAVNTTTVITSALIMLPYKDRMMFLNTSEGNSGATPTNYPQRARWSQNGSSIDYTQGWRDDIVGRGGFVDAPTSEVIVSAGFVKDVLIVYFERSTWQLVYTSNEILPFVWQRVNAELGAESTFSAVQFDNGLIAFGNVGIHASNGFKVERIDQVIPDEVFNAHNNLDGPLRTSGIRDFFLECVYFAYSDGERNAINNSGKTFFPNQIMVYNYRNNTFSFFNDNVTSFGYYQSITDIPWSGLIKPFTWAGWGTPWNSHVLGADFPLIAFGNQQGFVEFITSQDSSNDASLIIQSLVGSGTTSTITSPQHNLSIGQYVTILNSTGSTNLNNITFRVSTVPDANTFTIDGLATGTYSGNGIMIVRSNIEILTKQFTPYWTKGKRYDLKYIDMLFDKTSEGELAVDIFVDFSDTSSMTDTSNGVVLGNSIISTAAEGTTLPYYSFQQLGAQIWKRFYTVAMGETFQVKLSFDDTEMRNSVINDSSVVLHAMIFYFEESGEFY